MGASVEGDGVFEVLGERAVQMKEWVSLCDVVVDHYRVGGRGRWGWWLEVLK